MTMTPGISPTDKKWLILAGVAALALFLFWPRRSSAASSTSSGSSAGATSSTAQKQAATAAASPTVPAAGRLPGQSPTPFGSAGYSTEVGAAGFEDGLLSGGGSSGTDWAGTDEEAEMAAKDFR